MNKRILGQKNGKNTGFSILVTALCFLLIILIAFAIKQSAPRKYDYYEKPSAILNTLNNGRYIDALDQVVQNRAMGIDEKTDADYAVPYAVCDYFEAYSYYLAYQRVGDEARAAEYEKRMQACYDKMGTLQFMAEDIREALNKESTE
ncbi:MAG: hypothetical protein IJK56_10545 [Firmicutes bacterium]|nr:hypothetical protein [Bacillota bacterium]